MFVLYAAKIRGLKTARLLLKTTKQKQNKTYTTKRIGKAFEKQTNEQVVDKTYRKGI